MTFTVPDGRFKTNIMHAEDARFVFIRVHGNLWIRTDSCVASVKCPMCGSDVGVPCKNKGGFRSATHFKRRYLVSSRRRLKPRLVKRGESQLERDLQVAQDRLSRTDKPGRPPRARPR